MQDSNLRQSMRKLDLFGILTLNRTRLTTPPTMLFLFNFILFNFILTFKSGFAEIRTRICGFKVQCDNRYTTKPFTLLYRFGCITRFTIKLHPYWDGGIRTHNTCLKGKHYNCCNDIKKLLSLMGLEPTITSLLKLIEDWRLIRFGHRDILLCWHHY